MNRPALLLAAAASLAAEGLYFPPENDARWERVEPAAVGWNSQALEAVFDFARSRRSSAVVILHRGRILAERHWDPPVDAGAQYRSSRTPDGQVLEDVASVQKSVTATLFGIARHKGLVSLDDPASKHLGAGWTRSPASNEAKITLRHLLTMTSGLTDSLEFEAEPGSKWRYNSVAYRRLLAVLAKASAKSENEFTRLWLTGPAGMTHSKWQARPLAPDTFGFLSTARDLARFGLLIAAGGVWNGKPVIEDRGWLRLMLSPSQQLNPAYGFLWWLNGHPVLRANGTRSATLIPGAPADLVAALGALGRKVYVVPSRNLVVTRTGADPGPGGDAPFDREFWRLLGQAAGAGR